ncbi:F0F1 ATP synthase subunit B [Mycoplasma nasistruthionis]|uniref:ATP synthase subunit b n=2 Tax=Mycoplasma nasistruthionis TaxID=353852 RepID=A0A4Y6I8N7_9MOLU|nr:F0F1 ATP synthase subunit B [Mycoplasma nasistruthionis]QDF65268.1 F0F1 ATP synthase subunit B [Mycoplasma nasistruthionis]
MYFAETATVTTKESGTIIKEKFDSLFPSVSMMIATIIAFGIVFLILTYLLYKPVKAMMKRRAEYIQSNIDQSLELKNQSLTALDNANEKLKEAHKQADLIVTQAKIKSAEVTETYLAKAKADAKRLREETDIDIASQQREFDNNAKQYIVKVATEMAEQILKKEISKESQDQIIDKFLNS